MVCVFGLFIPPPAASVTQTGNITRADEQEEKISKPEDISLTGSCAGGFTAGSTVVGQCDTRPYLQASKQMERSLVQHLNPFFHGCQFWNRQQPLKTEVYAAYIYRGPATVPCHVL